MILPLIRVCIIFGGVFFTAFSGGIRTLKMNESLMEPINLRMGHSTVIRFSEKPNKVVIGNQNYFAVEFIDNDITIQPLGSFVTNLFVYTPHHVYGFLLKSLNYGKKYDDIVNVRWKPKSVSFRKKKKRVKKHSFTQKKINLNLTLKDFKVQIHRIIFNKERGSHILDFTLKNVGFKRHKTKDIKVFMTRFKKRLENQDMVFSKDTLEIDEVIQGRVLIHLKVKRGFSFNIKNQNHRAKKIILKELL